MLGLGLLNDRRYISFQFAVLRYSFDLRLLIRVYSTSEIYYIVFATPLVGIKKTFVH